MRSIFVIVAIVSTSCSGVFEHKTPSALVKAYCQRNVDSLKVITTMMEERAEAQAHDELDTLFRRARMIYKRTEAITEFYFPAASRAINGPAIDKLEEDDEKIVEATGFQVLEELIYPTPPSNTQAEIAKEARILNSVVTRLQALVRETEFNDENIFESMRLELLRMAALGLTGFDSPVCNNSIPEADAVLNGLEEMMGLYGSNMEHDGAGSWSNLRTEIYFARKELGKAKDFNQFDRGYFITRFFNPLCRSVHRFQQDLNIPNNEWRGAIDLSKSSFFENDVFDLAFFTPTGSSNDARVRALGKLLFFDPILSGNNSRSCASCHKPSNGFAENAATSIAFDMKGQLSRNAPTLINSLYQQNQFWDSRVAFIDDQINDVINNKDEMHGDLKRSVENLGQSVEYRVLFEEAFGTKENSLNESNIRVALAAYVRSLRSHNSRFDAYLKGKFQELSENEIHGFNLFMGKAKCATCHFFPLFNGTVPPLYKETELEVLGVPDKAGVHSLTIDEDPGRFKVFPHLLLKNMFKTPMVRNAALTAPYMHNGVFGSLEEVIDFYDHGGGAGSNLDVENQTLPSDSLHLTPSEKRDIIAFIATLSDTVGLTHVPRRLPSLASENLNAGTIAGDY
jgi:cytochrome c peroxidase